MSGDAKRLLQSAWPDFILALIISASLCYAVLSGFNATLGMRENIVLTGVLSAVMLLILYFGQWSRTARAVSIGVAFAYGIGALFVSIGLMPADIPLVADETVNDIEGNYAIYTFVILGITVLVYILSRRPLPSVLLTVASVFTCCVVQFLFREWLYQEAGIWYFLAAFIACLAMVVYQRYRHTVRSTDTVTNPSFWKAAASALVISLVAFAAGAAVFYAVMAPMQIETPVIKPFKEYVMPPKDEYKATYDNLQVEDQNQTTDDLNEDETDTQQNNEGGKQEQQNPQSTEGNPEEDYMQSTEMFDNNDWDEEFDPSTIEIADFWFIISIIIAIAAIAAVIWARYSQRERRLRRISHLSNGQQVEYIYDYLVKRFARLDLKKPATSTPLEYAYDFRHAMDSFAVKAGEGDAQADMDFVAVTLIYQQAAFGDGNISDDELEAVRSYYRKFFKNARRHTGNIKWIWKFWRI